MIIGDISSIIQGSKQKKEGQRLEGEGRFKDLIARATYEQNTKQNLQQLQSLISGAESERDVMGAKYDEFGRSGMSEAAKSFYSDMAARNLGTTLGAARDRRSGLVGMGNVYQSSLDSARELSAMDAEIQRQNELQALGYGERATEANIAGSFMPFQYQTQRQEQLEGRQFSEADAAVDYGRAIYGAGQQNVMSGIQGIEDGLFQSAAFILSGGLSGLVGGADADGASAVAGSSGNLYQGFGKGGYGNPSFDQSISRK